MVNLTINGIKVRVSENLTILQAAETVGIKIPRLCYWKELNQIGACRICVVEVDGYERLIPSCETLVEDGMVVQTHSPRVLAARKTILQLILSQHNTSCTSCVRNGNCALQNLSRELNIHLQPYEQHLEHNSVDPASPLIREADKCVKCLRCIQVCDNIQTVHIWDLLGTGAHTTVGVRENLPISQTQCSYCGQCVTHCPVGALTERDDVDSVLRELADPEVKVLVQVAPAIRVAWAEAFGLSAEFATPKRLAALMRRIGFDFVFDTNFSADLTIMEEASEFIERFTHRDQYQWPMFTSCCPGWVRFVKSKFPEFTANLSSAKSPQQMFGAIAKSFFAEKVGVDPKKLRVVSVMPCLAKKSECELEPLRDGCGDADVDIVLTTREATRLIREKGIVPSDLPEEDFDSPLGSSTGAAVIFGATGGVMDAALRTAYHLIEGVNPNADSFKSIRGAHPWKEATFTIPSVGNVKVAVVSGLGNARKLLEALNAGSVSYDFVEVMACPGGCAGGGGQPIFDGEERAFHRGELLWKLDSGMEKRFSHENCDIQALYDDFLEKPLSEKAHRLLHTDHFAWQMPSSN